MQILYSHTGTVLEWCLTGIQMWLSIAVYRLRYVIPILQFLPLFEVGPFLTYFFPVRP